MANISVISANENNLKDISVDISKNLITVVTGVSGSGKSSLVFDTIYAESERMFLESISMNMRNIVSTLPKPKVYKITNLLPSIAISQKQTNRNPRSYVGTVTDIAKFLRLLFSKITEGSNGKKYAEGDFSYNNPSAWCKDCHGTGLKYYIDESKVIGDTSLSISDGAILYWKDSNEAYYDQLLKCVCDERNISETDRFENLDKCDVDFLLYGTSGKKYKIKYKNYKNKYRTKEIEFIGVLTELTQLLDKIKQPSTLKKIQKFLKQGKCDSCNGQKLNKKMTTVRIGKYNYPEVEDMAVSELKIWINNLNHENLIGSKIISEISSEINSRIEHLESLGLGYLSLNRNIPSLSGGELQRVRLSNQLSCGLSGLLYVLDEPTMGLHSNDISKIISLLRNLKSKDNTILLVEHNREIMHFADEIIDMGIGGGANGGNIIAVGTYEEVMNNPNSLTGKYLSDSMKIEVPSKRRNVEDFIKITGAKSNNVIDQNFNIPIGVFTVLTGVSGSGKSSFTDNVLIPSLSLKKAVNCEKITGTNLIKKVISVDQSPIGRTPKSNIATYTGVFDIIRDMFSETGHAKEQQYTKSHFSFNVDKGRCEKCQGDGYIKIDMSFMADTFVLCDECLGMRYKKEVLAIYYKDKNIYEVLSMTVLEASMFFNDNLKIQNVLKCLIDVGLDYITLGQPANTLSGGEAQRVKLAKYLSAFTSENNLYILDEPSVGLHFDDVSKLIKLFNQLVNVGSTLLVIEHNLEIIKCADFVIDMGLNAGNSGGKVVDCGTPEQIVLNNIASVAVQLSKLGV